MAPDNFENRQDNDGTAHLAYFDVASQASFVWNNTMGVWVDVNIGGYAEPLDHRMALPFDPADLSIVGMLPAFEQACREHAATLPVLA